MSVSGMLLLGLGWVLMASTAAASQQGLDTNFYNKSLRLVPPNLPSNITSLTLSHNRIQMSVDDITTLRNYTKLTELLLDNNEISALPDSAFSSLSELKILSLSENSIRRVEPGAFRGLGMLRELNLSHNPLQSLPPGLFTSLRSLESLSLQECGLQTLDKDTFSPLAKLTQMDVARNPWNCSCDFVQLIRKSGAEISPGAACASPKDREGKTILDNSLCVPKPTTAAPPLTAKASSTQPVKIPTPTGKNSSSSMNRAAAPVPDGGDAQTGSSWKFLAGVLVTALGTSTLLVCAIKAPSWYKLFFNYRHQRLREEEEPNVFTTGRYSTFSLATEHTETSGHQMEVHMDGEMDVEMDLEMEEEDGYIEDRYIETTDYKVVEDA